MQIEEVWPLLRQGCRVRNGQWKRGSYIVLQRGYPNGIPINHNTAEATGIPRGTVKVFQPYIMLHTAEGSFVPYVATQSDLLSEVWEAEPLAPSRFKRLRPIRDNPQA